MTKLPPGSSLRSLVSTPTSPPSLVRGLGLLDATMILIGGVIGSGIFFAPSIMAGFLQTPGLLIGLWVLGGVLTLCGALSAAELGGMYPRSGGMYVFIREAFGPLLGFLYGWTYFLAIITGVIAAVCVAFAKTLAFFLPAVGEGNVLFRVGGMSFNAAQPVAVGIIVVLTWVNIRSLRLGANVQNVFTLAKIAGLLGLVLFALFLGGGSTGHWRPLTGLTLGPEGLKIGLFAALAGAMAKALFAYDAWYVITFVAEEVREPEKNVPRALIYGTLGATLLYLAAVAVYLYAVPITEMAAIPENSVATEAARRMIGGLGASFIAAAILVSTFGCANGLILTGARIVYAMAKDNLFFPVAARVHPTFRTPWVGLLMTGGVAALLTLSGTYSDLLTLTAFSSLLFNTLVVVSLFVLRHKQPNLARPYRTFGYPVTPALFILVSLFFLVYIPVADPRNAFLGLGISALGLPAYLIWKSRSS